MQILALETSGRYGSAAVIDDNGMITCARSTGEMSHLSDIINLVDTCIKEHGIGKADISHVAASRGPGSFTGIRIGVSAARALGQAMDIPCIEVSSLEVLAVSAAESDEFAALSEAGSDIYICTIINARRRQTYGALWHKGGTVMPERQYMIEELLDEIKQLDGSILFTGDGLDAYYDIIKEWAENNDYKLVCSKGIKRTVAFTGEELRYQTANAAAEIALRKALSGDTLSYGDLMPEYMRKSEAEMRLEDGSLSGKIGRPGN